MSWLTLTASAMIGLSTALSALAYIKKKENETKSTASTNKSQLVWESLKLQLKDTLYFLLLLFSAAGIAGILFYLLHDL